MLMTPTDNAYVYIKDKILNGTFRPSQKLTESQLSEVIGVSRNTVKKALLMLEKENLVEVEKNKGATIKSFNLEEIINYLEIREALEGLVARKAVKNITHENLRKLDGLYQEMSCYIKENRLEEYSQKNKEFHDIIYDASNNNEAVTLIKTIKTQLSRLHIRTILLPGRNQESIKEHERILIAFKERDEVASEDAVKAHIFSIRMLITDNYNYLV